MVPKRFHNATLVALSMVLVWCLTPKATAQSSSLEVSQYLVTHWRAQDGNFQGSILSLAQTKDGYIWLGTGFGLLRFDGIRFTEWKDPVDGSLPKSPLGSLLATKDGSLWIAGTGVSELRDGKMYRYHEFDGIVTSSLAEDVDGSVWVGATSKPGHPALCRIQAGIPKCFTGSQYPQGFIDSLFVDSSGRSWAASEKGLYQIGPGPPKFVGGQGMSTGDMKEDLNGTLLLANGSALDFYADGGVIKHYSLPTRTKTVKARRLLRTANGEIWIATHDEGIVQYHEGRVDKYGTQDGLPTSSLNAMLQDHEGNIWVASGFALSRFRRPPVAVATVKQGLAGTEVLSVLSTNDNSTWVGSVSGLNRILGSVIERPRVALPSNTVMSLFQTVDGRLLVATDTENGLVWLDHHDAIPMKASGGPNIFDISSGAEGELWLVTRETGLRHLSASGDLLESWPWKAVGISATSLAFDATRDGVWLGGRRGQLGLWRHGTLVEHYGIPEGLGDGVVRDIHLESDGSVWAATHNGLARIDKGKFSFLSRENGLPCNNVHWTRHGGDGSVWLYTECGLVQLSAEDVKRWAADSSHQVAVLRWLTNFDGIENQVYGGSWYTPQATETRDGRILFALDSGLGIIDERSGRKNSLVPPVKIETVQADGRLVDSQGEYSLPKRVKKVQFGFTALSFSSPQQVLFRYQLEGFDTGLGEPGKLREAEYTNLPPGHYRFHVIACNNDGVWNNIGAVLPIYIPAAFTQTLLFKLLLAAFVGLVLFTAYHYRTSYLLRQTKARLYERMSERERIARDLHDTFFQGIQGLLLRFQTGTNAIRPTEPVRAVFEEILGESDQIMLEGRELVLDLRTRLTDEEGLAQALAQVCERLKVLNPVDYIISVQGKPILMKADVREAFLNIGKEALANAFRHSKATKIEIELVFSSAFVSLRVRDDGCGISSAIQESGSRAGHFGLPGMRERAEQVGASFELWSHVNAGTEIAVHMAAQLASLSHKKSWAWLRI